MITEIVLLNNAPPPTVCRCLLHYLAGKYLRGDREFRKGV